MTVKGYGPVDPGSAWINTSFPSYATWTPTGETVTQVSLWDSAEKRIEIDGDRWSLDDDESEPTEFDEDIREMRTIDGTAPPKDAWLNKFMIDGSSISVKLHTDTERIAKAFSVPTEFLR